MAAHETADVQTPSASSASGTRPGNRPKRPLLQITYFIPQAGLDKCWIRVSSSVKSILNIYLTTAVGILNDAHLSAQIRCIFYQHYNQLVPFWRNLVSQDCGGGGLAMPWQSTLVVAGSPCTRHYPPPSPPPSPCPCSSVLSLSPSCLDRIARTTHGNDYARRFPLSGQQQQQQQQGGTGWLQ